MPVDRSYTDPRLAAIYDLENSGRWDIDFYLGLASSLGADRVADVGCGTGVLAADLAAPDGREVVGVDPAEAMLAVARGRPGGERVRWVCGAAEALPEAWADLVVMSGHVAQVFLTDASWAATLADCARSLRPGGRVAFESRNPAVRAWETWTPESTRGTYGGVTTWIEVTSVAGGVVTVEGHNLFPSGEDVLVESSLRFRTLEELETSLAAAGLTVESAYGDWDRGPLLPDSRELILVARRA